MCTQDAQTGVQTTNINMPVSDFIASTLPLLDMEKNAEVAQVAHVTLQDLHVP